MTSAILQSELSSLIQESKKKYPDVRTAAEASLADLKALTVTSEAQLAGDLTRRPGFVEPFILACKSKSPKLASGGVTGLQRLAASRAINQARLQDVLQAFREVLGTSVEVQLKILQTLPSLLHFNAEDLTGDRLATLLEICGVLQNSKTSTIANTAAATFQQLATVVFDRDARMVQEAKSTRASYGGSSVSAEDGVSDAASLFRDLCALLNGEEAVFMRISAMPTSFLLDVIGNLVADYEELFSEQSSLLEPCRVTLIPAASALLTAKTTFNITVRVLRVMYVLLHHHFASMHDESRSSLFSMLKCLEADSNPTGKRVLCMEVFRRICQEPSLVPRMFEMFDHREAKKGPIAAMMDMFARISSEDPGLIGLGRQSTVPVRSENPSSSEGSIVMDPSGVGGTVGGVASASFDVTGISTEWSVVKVPLMEQVDKIEPSQIPTTYIYSLVLDSLVALAEGLSKFIMPLSVPPKMSRHPQTAEPLETESDLGDEVDNKRTKTNAPASNKYHRLVNPLLMEGHPMQASIQVCADFIKTCWPAFLAACSTFLNSALDSIYYHSLIRAFQKMAQVSGILDLVTPRDAFLTALAKGAIPVGTQARTVRTISATKNAQDEDVSTQVLKQANPMGFADTSRLFLTVRNLLCMRALLNLGIALGPAMNAEAWSIILETLQNVDILINLTPPTISTSDQTPKALDMDAEESRSSVGVESAAVRAATKRLFESTKGYSDESFGVLISTLFNLIGFLPSEMLPRVVDTPISPTPKSPDIAKREGRMHQASRSMSGIFKAHEYYEQEVFFVLDQIDTLTRFNIKRFASVASLEPTWDLIIPSLLQILSRRSFSSGLRLNAGKLIDSIAIGTASILRSYSGDAEELEILQTRCLSALLAQLRQLESDNEDDIEVHSKVLDALESILGQIGESLSGSWKVVFQILRLTFIRVKDERLAQKEREHKPLGESVQSKAPALTQTAFRSVQLIVSDFVREFPQQTTRMLVDVLALFGFQMEDLNVSLTTVSLFWNIASLVSEGVENVEWTPALQHLPLSGHFDQDDNPVTADLLWLHIVLRMSALCRDEREDVRTSSIRVLFRSLEACGAKLSGAAWNDILQLVGISNLRYFHLKSINEDEYTASWQKSLSQMLECMCEVIGIHADVVCKSESFATTWTALLETCLLLFNQKAGSIWTITFSSMSRLLRLLRQTGNFDAKYGTSALDIWYRHHPSDLDSDAAATGSITKSSGTPNQESFVQHALVFVEASQLLSNGVNQESLLKAIDLTKSMELLKKTIFCCRHPPYTTDVKKLSVEQEQVILILSFLRELTRQQTGIFVRYLLEFVRAAVLQLDGPDFSSRTSTGGSKESQNPTWISFSTSCIGILNQIISSTSPQSAVFSSLSPPETLTLLAKIIRSKYSTLPQNDENPLWQKASVTANNVVASSIYFIRQRSSAVEPALLSSFFTATTAVAGAMLNATGLSDQINQIAKEKILADEAFDVTAFKVLHGSIVPSLGLQSISDSVSITYILTLFHSSLVAEPWFFDFPDDLLNDPLIDLNTVRRGTVTHPAFFPRQEIPYAALDALFDLVAQPPHSQQDETEREAAQRLVLAKAAAPYVLLRTAHAFKSYMADQPLRGLAPLPQPLQHELSTLLTKMIELRCDDRAFARLFLGQKPRRGTTADERDHLATRPPRDAEPGTVNDGKSHLRILYPLALRLQEAWRATWRFEGPSGETGEGWAWQDGQTGRAIQEKLDEWSKVLAEGWGI